MNEYNYVTKISLKEEIKIGNTFEIKKIIYKMTTVLSLLLS